MMFGKTHYSEAGRPTEKAACGSVVGKKSRFTNLWKVVDCRLCLKKMDEIRKNADRIKAGEV